MQEPVSRRGVYYDLSISPYVYKTAYGDTFKFSSAKKLEIYTRDLPGELEKVDKLIQRNDLADFVPEELVKLIKRKVTEAFYNRIEG